MFAGVYVTLCMPSKEIMRNSNIEMIYDESQQRKTGKQARFEFIYPQHSSIKSQKLKTSKTKDIHQHFRKQKLNEMYKLPILQLFF